MDTELGDDGTKIRKVEEEMFMVTVKKEVEATMGPWRGTVEENKKADDLISRCVKSSFYVYEKSRNDLDELYFKF